ncbi:MAG: OmpA family protein [Candidatus Brocadiia bacterium]
MKRVMVLVLVLFALGLVAGCKPNEGRNASLAADLEKARAENEQLKKEIEDLRRELNICADERNEWRDKTNGAQVKLQELENMIAKMKFESIDLKAKLEELEKRNARLESERGGLEGMLKNLEGVRVSRRGDEICLTLEDKILFDSGKADLKSSASKTLKQIADAISKNFKGRHIRIEGHTDSDPITKAKVFASNWELSVGRAATVLHELVKDGLPESGFSIAGFAFHRPVAPNDTPANKAKNRRVEIIIMAEEK